MYLLCDGTLVLSYRVGGDVGVSGSEWVEGSSGSSGSTGSRWEKTRRDGLVHCWGCVWVLL